MGEAIHDTFGGGDPGGENVGDQNALFARITPPTVPKDNTEAASMAADQKIRDDMARRRASRTLFTGGQGVLDRPSTTSNTLLGT